MHTRKYLHSDLEELYTGEEIPSFLIYSQLFTILWSVLTFSSGMPILYPIAMVSFMLLYVIYKTLLIKYYTKTTAFNQELPDFAIFYFKIGIFIHVIMAAFIFSNENLLSTGDDAVSGFLADQVNKIGPDGGKL